MELISKIINQPVEKVEIKSEISLWAGYGKIIKYTLPKINLVKKYVDPP